MTRLYLVRHAEPAGWQGRAIHRDAPLSAAGREAAARLAESFASLAAAALYVSPMRRAAETAEPIAAATSLEPVRLDAVAEIDFGEWEGRTFADIAAADPALFERWMAAPVAVHFPGGESYADLRTRSVAAMHDLVGRHRDEAAVVVAHGGPIRAMLAEVLAMPDDTVFRLGVALASVSVIEWSGDDPVVLGLSWERP